MDESIRQRLEIWDGEVFRGFAATSFEQGMLERLILNANIPEQESRALLEEIGFDLTIDRLNYLRGYLEANQAEPRDPRQQFINRSKNRL